MSPQSSVLVLNVERDRDQIGGRDRWADTPLLEVAKHYLEKRRGFIARSTYKEWERKFRYMNSVLAKLRKEKKVDTTSPAKLSAKDVSSFMEWGKEKGIQAATMEKYVMLLAKLCAYSGNPVFERMRAEGENFPHRTPKDLKSLGPQDLIAIQKKANGLIGWGGIVARFIVAMYPYSGLRPSELRLAHIEDLDTRKWQIWVRHPKGEGKYARQRHAPILYPAREAVLNYLKEREVRLKKL